MLIAVIALLAAAPTQFTSSQEPARIYIYAPRETNERSWRPILCDGALVAKIRRGTFFALDTAPGSHTLTTEAGVLLVVDLRAGHDQFVRIDRQFTIGEPATVVLTKIQPELAHNEMRFTSYIDSRQALSSSVSKTDPRSQPELQLKRRGANP